jgi:urease accessory protein
MLKLNGIVGHRSQPGMADRLHDLAHRHALEIIDIAAEDAERRRLRLTTDHGTDCAISLAPDDRLTDGAVLLLEPARAIVARVGSAATLRLRPASAQAALHLGWHAGNLHWRVRFDGGDLVVLLDQPPADALARLAPLLEAGEVVVVETQPPAHEPADLHGHDHGH